VNGIDGPARLRLDNVMLRLQRGPLDRATIATIIAEQLSDAEFDALAKGQRAAVALRRLGLSAMHCAEALDIGDSGQIHAHLAKAKERGVAVERERAA
jgi:hypothetical protein